MKNDNKSIEELKEILLELLESTYMETLASISEETLKDMWEHFILLVEDSETEEELTEKLDAYIKVMQAVDYVKNLDDDGKKNFKIRSYINQVIEEDEEYTNTFDTEEVIDTLVVKYQNIMKNKELDENKLLSEIYSYLNDESLMKTKSLNRMAIEYSKEISSSYDFELEDVLDNFKEIFFEYKEDAIYDYIDKSDTLTVKDITEDFFYENKLSDIYMETYIGYVCKNRLEDIVKQKQILESNVEDVSTLTKEELSEILFERLYSVHLETVAKMGSESLDDKVKEDFETIVDECTDEEGLVERLDSYIEEISSIHTLENLDDEGKFYLKVLEYIHYIIENRYSDIFTTEEEVNLIVDGFLEVLKDKKLSNTDSDDDGLNRELVDAIMSYLEEKSESIDLK